MIKISVLMPIYNTEQYLRQALNSAVNQTMKNIEIICVNDGSTDSTKNILDEYASKDKRIKIVNKKNTGYGNTMNIAIEKSQGEYLTILEPDDFIELTMCDDLYNIAMKYDLDVVKSNQYHHYNDNKKDKFIDFYDGFVYKKVFCPQNEIVFFTAGISTVGTLYKRSFIMNNNIRYTETPRAAFQDTAFNFKVSFYAKKMMIVPEAYYHYRQDNDNSSRNQRNNTFSIADEYNEIEAFINRNCYVNKEILKVIKVTKYRSYSWWNERSTPEMKKIFHEYFKAEVLKDNLRGLLVEKYFVNNMHIWHVLQNIINNNEIGYEDLKNKYELQKKQNKILEKNIKIIKEDNKNLIKEINDIRHDNHIIKKAIKIIVN